MIIKPKVGMFKGMFRHIGLSSADKAVSGGAPTYEYSETFDGAGPYDHVDLSTNIVVSGTPVNAIAQSTTRRNGASGYSIWIDVNDEAGDCYTYDVLTDHQTGIMYYKFTVWFEDGSTQWGEQTILLLQDAGVSPSAAEAIRIGCWDAGATCTVYLKVAFGTAQEATGLSYGTAISILLKVNQDVSTTGVEWKVNGVAKTTATGGASTLHEDRIFFGASAALYGSVANIYIDDFMQSTVASDVGWT